LRKGALPLELLPYPTVGGSPQVYAEGTCHLSNVSFAGTASGKRKQAFESSSFSMWPNFSSRKSSLAKENGWPPEYSAR